MTEDPYQSRFMTEDSYWYMTNVPYSPHELDRKWHISRSRVIVLWLHFVSLSCAISTLSWSHDRYGRSHKWVHCKCYRKPMPVRDRSSKHTWQCNLWYWRELMILHSVTRCYLYHHNQTQHFVNCCIDPEQFYGKRDLLSSSSDRWPFGRDCISILRKHR